MPLREQEVPRDDAGLAQGLSAAEAALRPPRAVVARWSPPPGVVLERIAETGSTQSDLLDRHAGPGAVPLSGTVVRVAGLQTRGRGRHGRTWVGAPGSALTFSLASVPARADLAGLSLVVGVALAEALSARWQADAPRLALKWPNDLVLLDDPAPTPRWRKLGGILIETSPTPAGRLAVIGVGLNVQAPAADAAGQPSGGCVEGWRDADVESVLAVAAPAVLAALGAFDATGFDAGWRERYARLDALQGLPLVAGATHGIGCGIAADGSLQLRVDDGQVVPVGSGEVRIRAWSASASGVAGGMTRSAASGVAP